MQRGLKGFEAELDLCIKEMPRLSSDPEAKAKKSLIFFSCTDKKCVSKGKAKKGDYA
jgi:hypothetical protein